MNSMNVTQAAQALGLHPNTVRNWVAIGRLRDVRPQGAAFLRLDPEEVAGLQAQSIPRIEGGTATFRLTIPASVQRISIEIERES